MKIIKRWLERRRNKRFHKTFFNQILTRGYAVYGESRVRNLLLKIPFIRAWYLRRTKTQMQQAAADIQASMIWSMQKGFELLEKLEPYTYDEKEVAP